MQNLLKFIVKYHFFILFILIELFCVYLIVQNNNYQKAKFINTANVITGGAFQTFSSVSDFVRLRKENELLIEENAMLKNQLTTIQYVEVPTYLYDTVFVVDTVVVDSTNNYTYLPAKVISNSINKQYNIVYLNKGTNDGLGLDMGVVDASGVVGVVTSVSKKFAVVMPIIHRDFNISVRVKRLGYFGNLSWNGKDPKQAQLTEIPNHIVPAVGDTIVTSGYSNIFPEDIVVGYVTSFEEEAGNGFLTIQVDLASDFGKLNYVYAIKNALSEDFKQLSIE